MLNFDLFTNSLEVCIRVQTVKIRDNLDWKANTIYNNRNSVIINADVRSSFQYIMPYLQQIFIGREHWVSIGIYIYIYMFVYSISYLYRMSPTSNCRCLLVTRWYINKIMIPLLPTTGIRMIFILLLCNIKVGVWERVTFHIFTKDAPSLFQYNGKCTVRS